MRGLISTAKTFYRTFILITIAHLSAYRPRIRDNRLGRFESLPCRYVTPIRLWTNLLRRSSGFGVRFDAKIRHFPNRQNHFPN